MESSTNILIYEILATKLKLNMKCNLLYQHFDIHHHVHYQHHLLCQYHIHHVHYHFNQHNHCHQSVAIIEMNYHAKSEAPIFTSALIL